MTAEMTAEILAELRRAALIEGHDAAHYPTSVVVPTRTLLALLDAATERDRLRSLADAAIQSDMEVRMELEDVEHRLCELLCDLTGGLLSKANYPVPSMVAAIEEHLGKYYESDAAAERDRLAAKLDAVRALAEHYAGLTNVDAGGAILRAIDAGTGGES